MKPFIPKRTRQPETDIVHAIRGWLYNMGWLTYKTHGSSQQSGFPDLYAIHPGHQARWIEVKQPLKISFTDAQRWHFPRMIKHGAKMWLLTSPMLQVWARPPNLQSVLTRFDMSGVKEPLQPNRPGLEWEIQTSLTLRLKEQGWHVMATSGSIYQTGFPDLYAVHPVHGPRWIEVKNPRGYKLEHSQIRTFREWSANHVGIWVTMSDDPAIVLKPSNVRDFL